MALSQQPDRIAVTPRQLLIRRMRASDVPGIMEIESVSFGSHHWAEESFLNEINNQMGRYYVLLDTHSPDISSQKEGDPRPEGKVIGYCGYWFILDEAHITTIAVHPAYRGNSLGEVQLLHQLDHCLGRTIHWVTLEVRASNYSAQNLYYKYGFRSAGLRSRYYQNNFEDALIMTTPKITSKPFMALYNQRKQELLNRIEGFPQGFQS